MRADEHSPWGETEIRELFARHPEGLAAHSEALAERIVAGATARRRRGSLLAVVGTAGVTLALVAAVVAGPLAPNLAGVTPVAPLTGIPTQAAQSPTARTTSGPGASPTAPAGATDAGPDVAGLLGFFLQPTELTSRQEWSLSPAVAPVGTAWLPGLQNCENLLASPTAGATPSIPSPHPVAIARAAARAPSAAHPSVDLVIAAWTPDQASSAIAQIADGTGGCVLVDPKPSVSSWPGHDGLLLRDVSGGYQRAGALQRVGDVTIGVTVVDLDPDHALAQAMAIGDEMASKARAAGIGKG